MNLFVVLLCFAASAFASLRWLRVAQREHYLAGSVTRFAARWWGSGPTNPALFTAAVLSAFTSLAVPVFAPIAALIVAAGPIGLSVKGRTAKLVWTRRLRTTAAVLAGLLVVVFGAGALTSDLGPSLAALACVFLPAVVDLALKLCAPFERRAAGKFVRSATAKLRATAPTTVAITGSYGKTTTKQYVRHLLGAQRSVLASPASFNNTGGLSRTLNEHLTPGTEVFVAEMGMYGLGEIRSMCDWVQPDVGVIVNIGPVHLERVGSLDGIVAAKSEIIERTRVAVVNISAHGLAAVADAAAARGQRVVRVSTEPGNGGTTADVRVVAAAPGTLEVAVAGHVVATLHDTTAHAANVAAALGVVIALDLDVSLAVPLLSTLPQPEHRQEVTTSATGVLVVDNTFSSNPASTRASLALVDRVARQGARIAVVTPGMVELGRMQFDENVEFAKAIDEIANDLVIVGHSNRKALVAGSDHRSITVHLAANRDAAVQWVRDNLREGDAVLYENDLPDHYP